MWQIEPNEEKFPWHQRLKLVLRCVNFRLISLGWTNAVFLCNLCDRVVGHHTASQRCDIFVTGQVLSSEGSDGGPPSVIVALNVYHYVCFTPSKIFPHMHTCLSCWNVITLLLYSCCTICHSQRHSFVAVRRASTHLVGGVDDPQRQVVCCVRSLVFRLLYAELCTMHACNIKIGEKHFKQYFFIAAVARQLPAGCTISAFIYWACGKTASSFFACFVFFSSFFVDILTLLVYAYCLCLEMCM